MMRPTMKVSSKAILSYRAKDNGDHALIFQVILNGKPIRFPLGFYISKKDFFKGVVRSSHPNANTINLIIEKARSRVTEIWGQYHLMERNLTPELLRKEFNNQVNRQDFIAFARQSCEIQKLKVDYRTYQQNVFALDKIETFKSPLLFSDLSEELLIKYSNFEKTKYGNAHNTIQKTLAVWKKYLLLAKKEGIKFVNPFDHFKIKQNKSFKISLTRQEVEKLFTYFYSDKISEMDRHVLRSFLFSCRTGLRISDIIRVKWEHLQGDRLIMPMHKNRNRKNKMIDIPLTRERELIPPFNPTTPTVFDCYNFALMNRRLKVIGSACGIQKNIEYHMSRHTFATTFLEGGGSVEVLQTLLGHEDINTTMVYVHMTDKRQREQKEKAFAV